MMSRIAELVNPPPLGLRSAGPFPQPGGAWLRRRPGSIIRTAKGHTPSFPYARALSDSPHRSLRGRSRGPSPKGWINSLNLCDAPADRLGLGETPRARRGRAPTPCVVDYFREEAVLCSRLKTLRSFSTTN
jgi:hypothetical protein